MPHSMILSLKLQPHQFIEFYAHTPSSTLYLNKFISLNITCLSIVFLADLT